MIYLFAGATVKIVPVAKEITGKFEIFLKFVVILCRHLLFCKSGVGFGLYFEPDFETGMFFCFKMHTYSFQYVGM